jgi:hypothetical protein
MSDVVTIPRVVWENLNHKIDFLVKAIQPLAKGYKAGDYMTTEDTLSALGIGPSRLKQIRASGAIRYRKFGKEIEYLTKDINDYKNGHIIIPNSKTAKA